MDPLWSYSSVPMTSLPKNEWSKKARWKWQYLLWPSITVAGYQARYILLVTQGSLWHNVEKQCIKAGIPRGKGCRGAFLETGCPGGPLVQASGTWRQVRISSLQAYRYKDFYFEPSQPCPLATWLLHSALISSFSWPPKSLDLVES